MNEHEKSKSNNKIKYAVAAILGGAGLYLGGRRFFKHMNQAPNINMNGVSVKPPGVPFRNTGKKLRRSEWHPNLMDVDKPTNPINIGGDYMFWKHNNGKHIPKFIAGTKKRRRVVDLRNRSKRRIKGSGRPKRSK